MTTAHTPGPWFYDVGETEALIVEKDGATVAEIRTTYQTTAHRSLEANARLMAAAPDLLAALEKIDANAAESVEWIRRIARAAIARTKGVTE